MSSSSAFPSRTRHPASGLGADGDVGAERARSRLHRIAGLLLILATVLAAIGLRLWGISYGLPHPHARPDEDLVVAKALRISLGLTRDPGDFNYSHLVYYLHALVLALYRLSGRLLGYYGDTDAFLYDRDVRHPGLEFLICRVFAALLGSATVLLTAWAAWEAHQRRLVAILASVLVAVNFLHARDSHFGTVDVPMTFFATAALGFALRAARTRRTRDYALSGFLSGLAASAKYNAVTAAFAGAAAALLDLRKPDRPFKRVAALLCLMGAMVLLAFALTSPYCLLRISDFLRGVAKQRQESFSWQGELAWHTHLRLTFPGAFGLLGCAAAAVGLVRCAWLRRPGDAVLLSFSIPTFAVLAAITWVQARYMVPLVPPLSIMAAEATVALLPPRLPLLACAAALLALQPLSNTVAYDRLASRKDTRLLAADWVSEHVPQMSRIAECEGYGAPALNDGDLRRPPAFHVFRVPCVRTKLEDVEPDYLIVHTHPYVPYFAPPQETLDWLQTLGEPLARFDPFVRAKGLKSCFFSGDAYYLPYCGFEGMERGGPIVSIWRLRAGSSQKP